MKKLFISQPMRNKTDEQIIMERKEAVRLATKILGEKVEVLDTFFTDFKEDAKPLHYLAMSIQFLAEADVVYFADGWNKARGCLIEHQCAIAYDVKCIYSN